MATQLACAAFATVSDLLGASCACDLDIGDAVAIQAALDAASDQLVAMSGGRFRGPCTATIRPTRPSCGCGRWDYGSPWTGAGWCGCSIDRILLDDPVISITNVTIDGVALNPGDYAVMKFLGLSYLVRKRADTSETASWPGWQDLTLPFGGAHTFSITYIFGQAVTIRERDAAIEIACEMLKTLPARKAERFPAGVTQASFQGATVVVGGESGPASFPAVSAFMAFWNPTNKPWVGVWSPDLAEGWSFAT